MAVTQLTNVIVPEVFTPYVQVKTMELSALARSGILMQDPQIAQLAQGAGSTFNLPFWNDLSGDSEVGSDDPAVKITPANLDAGKDLAIKHHRDKAWSTMDLAGEPAGSDPARVISDSTAAFWARDQQHMLIATLKGVFADNVANDSSDMVFSVATDTNSAVTSAEKISATAVLLGLQTMGDAANLLTAIVMHSVIHTELLKQNLIIFQPTSGQDIGWGTYLNKTVIVDDGCPAVAGTYRITYTTYLFGQGAVGYGDGAPKVPTEILRDPAAGNGSGMETLYHRRAFILHPRGVKWAGGSLAGLSPTNAELAMAANWDRVWARKHIRIAALKTNG